LLLSLHAELAIGHLSAQLRRVDICSSEEVLSDQRAAAQMNDAVRVEFGRPQAEIGLLCRLAIVVNPYYMEIDLIEPAVRGELKPAEHLELRTPALDGADKPITRPRR
jgi:hypothetical protein